MLGGILQGGGGRNVAGTIGSEKESSGCGNSRSRRGGIGLLEGMAKPLGWHTGPRTRHMLDIVSSVEGCLGYLVCFFSLVFTFLYPHNSVVILVHYHRRRWYTTLCFDSTKIIISQNQALKTKRALPIRKKGETVERQHGCCPE